MKIRNAIRTAMIVTTVATSPLIGFGCNGASDDRLGSGSASKEGSGIENGTPTNSSTQQYRNDKGDNPNPGTGRPAIVDTSQTGGLGGTRDNNPPGPGDTGPRSSTAPGVGPK